MGEIQTVAVIGAGIMGRGIAHVAALGGYRTILEDLLPASLRIDYDIIKLTELAHQVEELPERFMPIGISLLQHGRPRFGPRKRDMSLLPQPNLKFVKVFHSS